MSDPQYPQQQYRPPLGPPSEPQYVAESAPGTAPPGQLPAGQLPAGQLPAGQRVDGQLPAGQRVAGTPGPAADDLRFAAALVAALTIAGALLGFVWAAWSPPGPRALVVRPGVFVPDETESFVAGDGRFLVLVTLAGLAAALLTWSRVGRRGPLVALGLVLGGLLGSLLTELVGHLTGGGTFTGRTTTIIGALPLSLHTQGLLFVEAAVAALVYGLFVAFATHDDLGRPDPVRETSQRRSAPAGSVGAGDHPQDGGGHGDGPGPLQQGDLPPQ